MNYDRDIKRLVTEKNKLRKIKPKIGVTFFNDLSLRTTAKNAKLLIQEAIEKLHEAEIILRRNE